MQQQSWSPYLWLVLVSGSTLGGHIADRLNPRISVSFFAVCEIGIAFFAVGSVWLYHDFLPGLLSDLARSRSLLALILFAGFLFPTVLMGMSLPFLAKGLTNRIENAPQVISKLYAFNTLGAALGAFVTTWFLYANRESKGQFNWGVAESDLRAHRNGICF